MRTHILRTSIVCVHEICGSGRRSLPALLLCAAFLFSPAHAADTGALRSILADEVPGGLIVYADPPDSDAVIALGVNESVLVQGLVRRSGTVDRLRGEIFEKGRYGEVTVLGYDGRALPYAGELVRALIAEDPLVPVDELLRVVCPAGILITGRSIESDRVSFVRESGGWRVYRKHVPGNIDEWSHYMRDASGNMVSQDELVGPPRYTQWISGPLFQRSHATQPSIMSVISKGGRLFYLIDTAHLGFSGMPEKWCIIARDAYSGIGLWRRELGAWGSSAWSYWTEGHCARFNHPLNTRRRLVASDGYLFATLSFNGPVAALDPATGRTVRSFPETEFADEFVSAGGVLYVSVNNKAQKPWNRERSGPGINPAPPENPPPPSTKTICAVSPKNGRILWKSGPFLGNPAKPDRLGSMRHLNVTLGDKNLYLVDEEDVVALDLEDGSVAWKTERITTPTDLKEDHTRYFHYLIGENVHKVTFYDGIVYILHPGEQVSMKTKTPAVLQALDPENGEELWRYGEATPISYLDRPDIFPVDDKVWMPDRVSKTMIGLDCKTGQEAGRISIKTALDVKHHHRCYANRATSRYAILGRRGADFVDFETGELTFNHWARGGCRMGHVPANGIFYKPPDHCRCYMGVEPRGFIAARSENALPDFDADFTETNELVKGPEYGRPAVSEDESGDPWRTFRHDSMRSSSTRSRLEGVEQIAWSISVGSDTSIKELTAPVVAEGRVLLADRRTHRVYAFAADRGEELWSFAAGGRVDSSPTLTDGYALFGADDGCVYCLNAGNGKLAWKFRAALSDRQIVDFEQLASRWPVPGNILVIDSTAYFAAGRCSLLDKGILAYAVDVRTGRMIERIHIEETQGSPVKGDESFPDGALADVLSTNGTKVFLGRRSLPFKQVQTVKEYPDLASTVPSLSAQGGFRNNLFFHRAFWGFRSRTSQPLQGNLIAFNAKRGFVSSTAFPGGNNQTFYMPANADTSRLIGLDGLGPRWMADPNFHRDGTILFAGRSRDDSPDAGNDPGNPSGRKLGGSRKKPYPALWRIDELPICPFSLIVAENVLAVAGPAYERSPGNDPWAELAGRAGGWLYLVDITSGQIRQKTELDSPPVWNGMAAAYGKIYMTSCDNTLVCIE